MQLEMPTATFRPAGADEILDQVKIRLAIMCCITDLGLNSYACELEEMLAHPAWKDKFYGIVMLLERLVTDKPVTCFDPEFFPANITNEPYSGAHIQDRCAVTAAIVCDEVTVGTVALAMPRFFAYGAVMEAFQPLVNEANREGALLWMREVGNIKNAYHHSNGIYPIYDYLKRGKTDYDAPENSTCQSMSTIGIWCRYNHHFIIAPTQPVLINDGWNTIAMDGNFGEQKKLRQNGVHQNTLFALQQSMLKGCKLQLMPFVDDTVNGCCRRMSTNLNWKLLLQNAKDHANGIADVKKEPLTAEEIATKKAMLTSRARAKKIVKGDIAF